MLPSSFSYKKLEMLLLLKDAIIYRRRLTNVFTNFVTGSAAVAESKHIALAYTHTRARPRAGVREIKKLHDSELFLEPLSRHARVLLRLQPVGASLGRSFETRSRARPWRTQLPCGDLVDLARA
jgi:hypothetical protein